MFDRIRKAFQRDAKERTDAPASSLMPHGPVSEWAASRGMSFASVPLSSAVSMQGKVGGRNWRMELGRPTRDYIFGEELRARADLGVEDVGAMVISRPLKESLERRAYSMITDTLQTKADPNLPEEMRWLAMYDEVAWEQIGDHFWKRYGVLADSRENALAWVDAGFVDLLMGWPEPAPSADVPFMVVLLRGKCYLRMQYEPAETSTLDHATRIFTGACERALKAFGKR